MHDPIHADLSVFRDQAFLSLTTFRKTGAPVATPMWFAREDDKLYVMTSADTGKVRRVRRNAQVEVAPCALNGSLLGPPLEAMARILHEEERVVAQRALLRKYGWQKRLYDLTYILRGKARVYFEIMLM